MEGTHEPLIDKETFEKVQMLVASRKRTRSRTYDFLLKGMIFCHECGYPLAVLNRKNAKGEDVLYFVCRTYQRFTKAGVCACHTIKEQTVTRAVMEKMEEVCRPYLQPGGLMLLARQEAAGLPAQSGCGRELAGVKTRIDGLTANLDQIYMDHLSGILAQTDFQRIYDRIKLERSRLEEKRQELERRQKSPASTEDRAKELARRFTDGVLTNRELLVSLVERIELTADKQIQIKFRFKRPEQRCFEAVF